MKTTILFLLLVATAFAQTDGSGVACSFVESIPPYDHSWKASILRSDLGESANIDMRKTNLPLSIEDAVRLADRELAGSKFPFAKDLKLRSAELHIADPFSGFELYYVVTYDGRTADGEDIYLYIPVLMTRKVILPVHMTEPNQTLQRTPERERISPEESDSRRR